MPPVTRDGHRGAVDLAQIRSMLQGKQGPDFWRSLEEVATTDVFRDYVEHEFPEGADTWEDGRSRREFLKLMAASLAFGGFAACTRQPVEKLVPYVRAPEEIVPGKPLYYASALSHRGYATGVLVESHSGRPTKVEGNPDHPATHGATDAITQASILTLYDPDRSHVVQRGGQVSTWDNFVNAIAVERARFSTQGESGLRILTETVTSPTLAGQLDSVLEAFPGAKWLVYEPFGRDPVREGARRAFGEDVDVVYRVDRADVIVALDADFLSSGSAHLVHAKAFADRRRVSENGNRMNWLYAIESTPTNTGSVADHRLPLKPAAIVAFARELAFHVGVDTSRGDDAGRADWVGAIAGDLKAHRGRCLVLPGDEMPPEVHALAHAMNEALGNNGSTFDVIDPVEARTESGRDALAELVEDANAGLMTHLLMLGGNPVYTAPGDVDFAAALERIPFRAHLGSYFNETSRLSHWHVPEAHPLETWGDARAFDGTASIVQPLIEPLYGGRSSHEVVSVLLGEAGKSSYDTVRAGWSARMGSGFEKTWRRSLHDGVVAGTRSCAKRIKARTSVAAGTTKEGKGLRLSVRPDSAVWDGRYANNGWLQELPRPMTRLTWDNVLLVSPRTAETLALSNGDVVRAAVGEASVEAPVWVQPGQADEVLVAHAGFGRKHAGRVGTGVGFNAMPMIGAAGVVRLEKVGRRVELACTQDHHSMEGRAIVRTADLQRYQVDPHAPHEHAHAFGEEMTLYDNETHRHEGYAWGMTIDLNACTGCSACTLACQSENNIPVVGSKEVSRGREMHWIRVDRYYRGGLDEPEVLHQPVPCMHCENAPCEVVCPVNATVHSREGLNDMVYNRCVGTRYCSNNCPYKVRRFNFFHYSDDETESLKLMRNPDVTVRARGVMEKCTFCVQRINHARDLPPSMCPHPELGYGCGERFGDRFRCRWAIAQ